MAEAFGVAAGAIGVVSLSIQLAESLQKVKDFCATVRNAPSHIAELMEEIEIIQDIIRDLEDVCLSANMASSPNMHRCLKIAQRATKGLVSFSNELHVRIKKNRFRGGARLALSREEIKQMLSQLERTKSSLMLAYNIYREAVADDRHAVLLQAAVRREESSTRKTQVISVSSPIHGSSTRDGLLASPHKLITGTTLFRVDTPRWLSNTVWRLEMRRCLLGLTVFTRTYGVVSCEAPIFRACRAGNDVEMQRLIESGLASPFDENEFGDSLWTDALQRACIKSLRCLHQYGAATSYADGCETNRLTLFLLNAIAGGSAEPVLPYTSGRMLQEDLKWLSDACCHDECDSFEDDRFTGKTNLLSCQSIHADYVWIWRLLSFPFLLPYPVQILSSVPTEDMLRYYDPQDHDGMTPLQIVAVYAASCLARDAWEVFKVLEGTISGLITNDAELHSGLHGHTPLLLFLSTFYGLQNDPWEVVGPVRPPLLRRWLKWWLKALQNAGVDLVQYGSEEEKALEVFNSLEIPEPPLQYWYDMFPWYFNNDVVRFEITYGPEPEDWTVQAELLIEKYACDFWQMTQDESESLSIPGSWIDF